MNVVIGIAFGIALIIFFFYAAIAVKHTLRFRYLGPRIVWVTLTFIGLSAGLLTLSVATYLTLLLS